MFEECEIAFIGIPLYILPVSARSPQKPCIFIGASLKNLKRFPAKVQNRFGYALHQVQR
jgi:hypothetical protein